VSAIEEWKEWREQRRSARLAAEAWRVYQERQERTQRLDQADNKRWARAGYDEGRDMMKPRLKADTRTLGQRLFDWLSS
jgi:hypothetical protein